MASEQQDRFRGRPVQPQAPQEQCIPPPRDHSLPASNKRTHDYADRKRRRNPSYSRSRSQNREKSRHRYRKNPQRSRCEERVHSDSPDLSEDQHFQHRRGRNRKRRSRSLSKRPRSPSFSVHHRGDDRRRGRQRSRSVSTSVSSHSSQSRRESRRHPRRRSSRRHQRRRSSARRHGHRRRHGSEDNHPRRAPVANDGAARSGIVSDEDGDPARQHQRKSGHHAGSSVFGSAKDSGKGAEPKTGKYSTKKQSSRSSSHDDTTGHFKGNEGSIIADRYRVEREVGMGTFGRVVECLDLTRRSSRRVAVKIVRNVKRYYESAMIEAEIVEDVNRRGGRGVTHCAVMFDTFTFSGHYCMVFEKLGPSLYDFQKRQNYRPFPLACVRDFAKQLLETLEFLHSFRLIHTDLKPENVLLISGREVHHNGYCVPECTRIKLIDFGAATYDNEKKSSVVNTRQYRAPEVILGVGWSMPSDLWSLGCILVELFQGELLFATHDDIEHLALIEQVVGAFPRRMLKRGKNTEIISEAFGSMCAHRMERVLSPESFSYVKRVGSLESLTSGTGEGWFLRLLRGILVTDPKDRATARESLRTIPS